MSRRSRKPGPLKENAASPSQRFRTQVPQTNPWLTVNVFTSGALPTNVGDLTSDDIDNGVPGFWYYYDPNTTLDISGHSSNWVAQDGDGIEFYADLAKTDDSGNKLSWGGNVACNSGRIATAMMKPDGSGPFTFLELAGSSVEFLIERFEDLPHAENHDVGLFVALANNTVMSSTTQASYGLGSYYFGTSAGDDGVNHFLFNPQNKAITTSADGRKQWGLHHFAKRAGAATVLCGWSTGKMIDGDGDQDRNTSTKAQQTVDRCAGVDDLVYLVVGVFATDASGGGSAVRRTGKFKIWYRINWNSNGFSPDYILQGDNHFSGASYGIR